MTKTTITALVLLSLTAAVTNADEADDRAAVIGIIDAFFAGETPRDKLV